MLKDGGGWGGGGGGKKELGGVRVDLTRHRKEAHVKE